MKIKGLLLGMLAYAAMVACTNEDIVKNNVNQPEKVKGNLSLVISSTSNSSRAADNEESGVTDPGIEGESTVTDAVIILNRLDENGNLTKEEFGGYLTKAQLNETTASGETIYNPFFTLANSGWYKVLVVLNPTESIEAIANSQQSTDKSKYEQIAESSYTTTGDITIAAAGQFMMVNKKEIKVDVLSNNYEDPTIKEVEVERVVSKINYVIAKPNNLYPLTVQTTDYAIAETTSGYYIYPDNKAVRLTGLHKAKNLDNDNSDVWIHEVKEILKKNHQEQLLICYDKLDNKGKEKLLDQILSVDFDLMNELYENTKKEIKIGDDKIEPIEYVDKSKLSKQEYEELETKGIEIIKKCKLAVLTMAGGQGTRLGYNGPKGTFDIGLDTHESLFELICKPIKEANSKWQRLQ